MIEQVSIRLHDTPRSSVAQPQTQPKRPQKRKQIAKNVWLEDQEVDPMDVPVRK